MTLFDPVRLGAKTAANRLFSQPMEANDCADGAPTARTIARYRGLAAGGWGTVCVESTGVNRGAIGVADAPALVPETAARFADLLAEMRGAEPGVVALIQLNHTGAKSLDPAQKPASYSAQFIEAVQQDFLEAARLAIDAGFDGIDFKLCHGYFTAELLRPSNRLANGWGGSWPDRTRFALSTYRRLRELCTASGVLLGVRISLTEPIPGGMGTAGPDSAEEDLGEPLDLLRSLATIGLDFVNVTAGDPPRTPDLSIPGIRDRDRTEHHHRYTRSARSVVEPVPVVGSAYSVLGRKAVGVAEAELEAGNVDMIGFGRACLADPNLPNKLRSGEKINWCTACNRCGDLIDRGLPTSCPVYDRKVFFDKGSPMGKNRKP